MVQAPTATCAKHRRRNRVASCGTCGHAVCSDCVVHTSVGIKCRDCSGVRSANAATGAHVTAAPARPVREPGSRRPWAVALVAAGFAVVAVAGYGMLNNGSDAPDEPLLTLAPATTELDSEFVGAGGLRIRGTLTLPGVPAGQTSVPAVLIVPGLGAIDRNAATGMGAAGMSELLRSTLTASITGNTLGPFDPLYKNLSESLADAGVASFRYDKRATSTSKLTADQTLSFDDEVADARAALEFLGGRREVGSSPLGVVGHDTGGVVAMRLAAGNPRVKAAVFLSTPSRPVGDGRGLVGSAPYDQGVDADGAALHDALPRAAEVMVGASDADHNLAVPIEGHTHANNGAVVKPGDNRDRGLTGRLSAWTKSRLNV